MSSMDSDFTEEERAALKELAQDYQDNSISRRAALGVMGAGAATGAIGASAIGGVSADASTSDSDGDIGTPNSRVDAFLDGAKARSYDSETSADGNRVQVAAKDSDATGLFDNGDKALVAIDHQDLAQDGVSGDPTGGENLYGLAVYTPANTDTVNGFQQIYEAGEVGSELIARGNNPTRVLDLKTADHNGNTASADGIQFQRETSSSTQVFDINSQADNDGNRDIRTNAPIAFKSYTTDTVPRLKFDTQSVLWEIGVDTNLAANDELAISRNGSGNTELVIDPDGGIRLPDTATVAKSQQNRLNFIVDTDNDQAFSAFGFVADDTARSNANAVDVLDIQRNSGDSYTELSVAGTSVMRLNDDGSIDVNGAVNGSAY